MSADAGVLPLVPPHVDGPEPRADLPHPAEFLGYELGERFTRHPRIVDYVHALAQASDRAAVRTYGETVEGRPLTYLVITSPANHARIDEIFAASRALGTSDADPDADLSSQPVIVWLGYGVHGNESSSAEAALAVAWTLVAGSETVGEAAGEAGLLGGPDLLEEVVVILDPLVNPDGRERYLHAFQTRVGAEAQAHPDAMEHHEPWPGGRFNHYLFDLNRDWAWLTQAETRQRLAAYRRIDPQVYVDVHEMGSSSTYYFAPPADPVLPLIGEDAFDDLVLLGDGNARAFDRRAWTYFVREVFDFYYPGYGDTYPTLRGGLGMTYEMAGGGGAGRIVLRDDGSLLTLAERVARHTVATLETVRTAARHRQRLVRGFAERRRAAAADPRTYLWSAGQPEAEALAELLAAHGLAVRRLGEARELRLRPVLAAHSATGDSPGESGSGERHSVERELPAGTYFVDTAGPLGGVARALLDRRHTLDDGFVERQRRRLAAGQGEQIFDVTAWSLPLAFGVETWIHQGVLADAELGTYPSSAREAVDGAQVGWLVPPQGLRGYRLAAALLREGVRFRVASAPITPETSMTRTGAAGESEESTRGTLFVAREDQDGSEDADLDLDETIERLRRETGAEIEPVSSSWSEERRSLGSGTLRRVKRPTIALVGGVGVGATSHGALWHLFDEQVGYPVRRIDRADLERDRIDLAALDVLILPDGKWDDVGSEMRERLGAWIRGGGQLLLVEDAWELAREAEWSALEERSAEAPESDRPAAEPTRYGPLDTEGLAVPGAFVASEVQRGHRLALGLPAPPPILVRGERFFEPSGDPRIDLLRVIETDPVLSGLVWSELEPLVAGSLLVATETVGKGRVVTFAQDLSFRGFTRAAMPLLLGAAFYGPSL